MKKEIWLELKKQKCVPLIFFVIGGILIASTYHGPLKDFVNYYYGSKLWLKGTFTSEVYSNVGYFNHEVLTFGEKNFFGNYIPVPPFTVLFYIPLAWLSSAGAKLCFNSLSLVFFCISLFRLLRQFKIHRPFIFILPLTFLLPFFNNISQGQTYLLIFSFLSESLIRSQRDEVHVPAIFLALSISLKLFPVFMCLYFFKVKNYRIVFWSLAYSFLLIVVTAILVSWSVTTNYYSSIVPRLINNDVVGAFYHGNQGFHSLLLNLFYFDALNNAAPLFNAPYLVPIIESLYIALLLSIYINSSSNNSLYLFGLTGFLCVLVGRYTASYALLLLIPFMAGYFTESKKSLNLWVVTCLLSLAFFIPVGSLSNYALIIKYSRLLLLIAALGITYYGFLYKINFKTFVFILVPLCLFKITSFDIKTPEYFNFQNSKGILYDIKTHNDTLILLSTLGDKDIDEKVALGAKARYHDDLVVKEKTLYYKNKIICEGNDNKQAPFLLNDSVVVFMSDLKQAVGFYKLRRMSLSF